MTSHCINVSYNLISFARSNILFSLLIVIAFGNSSPHFNSLGRRASRASGRFYIYIYIYIYIYFFNMPFLGKIGTHNCDRNDHRA
uniref:Putative secreted protein n=1 Tax=Ixodes ricinus TaxID=34613 RepID=A0A6B0U3V4_IXORI